MDILSKANSIVSEYDKIIKQMMDNDIILNQEKMTLLSREKVHLMIHTNFVSNILI